MDVIDETRTDGMRLEVWKMGWKYSSKGKEYGRRSGLDEMLYICLSSGRRVHIASLESVEMSWDGLGWVGMGWDWLGWVGMCWDRLG